MYTHTSHGSRVAQKLRLGLTVSAVVAFVLFVFRVAYKYYGVRRPAARTGFMFGTTVGNVVHAQQLFQ